MEAPWWKLAEEGKAPLQLQSDRDTMQKAKGFKDLEKDPLPYTKKYKEKSLGLFR